MNRIVLFGLTSFFAFVGICLMDGPKQAKAFHGWQMYGGWGCQGCHSNQRCYSGCSGCYGCGCCAGNGCASGGCGGCWSYQRCYGYYGCYGCEGVTYHSCHGCYGGCAGCGGYYRLVPSTIIVPVEPAPAISPPISSSGEKPTLHVVPADDSEFSDLAGTNAIVIGSNAAAATVFDPYIHEPR